MEKEEVVIEFNELYSSQIQEDIEVVSIVKDEKIQNYRIINTEEKLLKYVSNSTEYAEKQLKILVTFECTNICGNFYNAIFLKKFKIDSYCEPKIDDSLYLSFNNCYFFEDVELWGGDYKRIKINDSIMEKIYL